MFETIIALGVMVIVSLAIKSIYTVLTNTENYYEYVKNETNATCNMEDYKLSSHLR